METSILDLSDESLAKIKKSGIFPETITFERIEEREDFSQLYKLRNSPSAFASYLLSQRKKERREQESLSLKKAELELRVKKQTGQTAMLKDLKTHLMRLETKIEYIIQTLTKDQKGE